MQTVTDLDKNHSDIIAHRKQEFLEVLCLCRGLFSEDTATDLRQSVDDLRNLRTEEVLYVLYGIVCVLHHIVE